MSGGATVQWCLNGNMRTVSKDWFAFRIREMNLQPWVLQPFNGGQQYMQVDLNKVAFAGYVQNIEVNWIVACKNIWLGYSKFCIFAHRR